MTILWFSLFFVILSIIHARIITTSYGQINGATRPLEDGNAAHLYMGIPQAKPPVGDLRYKLPTRAPKWEGVLNATEYRAACPSNSTESRSPQEYIAEDCLYLNIFTSESCLNSSLKCPVIVYIHGGNFNYDSATMYNTTFLMEQYVSKDILFVLPAMRLGGFALLYFKNESLVPRNLPAYDIMMGLDFIHNEIQNFGGDPGRVTLMGHSSGGALVYSLAFSKDYDLNAQIFQQILPMSGPLDYHTPDKQINTTAKILEYAGCLLPSEIASFSCIHSLSFSSLLAAQRKAEEDGYKISGLVYDKPFFTKENDNFHFRLDRSPKRNMLAGSTSVEFEWKDDYEEADFGRFLGLKNVEMIGKKYKEDRQNAKLAVSNFTSYQSQTVFVSNIFYGIVQERKGANVWLYEYDQFYPYHAKDMCYFNGAHAKKNPTEDDTILRTTYITMISNFVKGEKPLKEFLLLNGTTSNYLYIKSNKSIGIVPQMRTGYHLKELNYWMEMTEYDKMLSNEDTASWVLPLIVGVVLFVIICIAMILFYNYNRTRNNGEAQPLLS